MNNRVSLLPAFNIETIRGNIPPAFVFFVFFILISEESGAQDSSLFRLAGLIKPVIIHTDRWGVSHIEAQTEEDLFFAQGYQAARDRLFQFELFRRQATGTVSEMLGPRELDRDIGARLFRFRGDITRELNHYHPRGERIIKAFVKGINNCVRDALSREDDLPLEFRLLNIKPGFWTPEDVVSRHQGLLGNVQTELQTARWLRQIGEERLIELMNYHPHSPDLSLDSLLTREALAEDILKWYNAFRRPVRFQKEDLLGMVRPDILSPMPGPDGEIMNYNSEGSNNWVISGNKTQSGYPIMANDPHRAITIPSLRYIVHLKAPGWNVIGGGEPILPGVSIGHNEHGAWGLTIFQTDMEDLYVYRIDPQNRNRYKHHGQWLMFKTIADTVRVKGHSPVKIEHRYSVHGPVVFVDTLRNLAYAVRCAWLETGAAPYLASLRMNQARSWAEFRQACAYSFVPAENMVWADRKGNIGWQAVGLAPVRKNHSGMVPVIDHVTHEWSGYQPVLERPGAFNPREGFIATANENLTPPAYPYMQSIGYNWADPYRGMRIREVLQGAGDFLSRIWPPCKPIIYPCRPGCWCPS
ncbi:MAG TPA: penicillin acylase family protein [Saprospiraceae bacterium]|nr:penicillin acylase family protein [Saprospiraceae bacterium]HNT21912.1 penicillin acylase family protein [Saprospiraceae bacterium]